MRAATLNKDTGLWFRHDRSPQFGRFFYQDLMNMTITSLSTLVHNPARIYT
jgi:hypothetical protein